MLELGKLNDFLVTRLTRQNLEEVSGKRESGSQRIKKSSKQFLGTFLQEYFILLIYYIKFPKRHKKKVYNSLRKESSKNQLSFRGVIILQS